MHTDPVCGASLGEADEGTSIKSYYGGKTYYFCSEECQDAFEDDPEMYVEEAQ